MNPAFEINEFYKKLAQKVKGPSNTRPAPSEEGGEQEFYPGSWEEEGSPFFSPQGRHKSRNN